MALTPSEFDQYREVAYVELARSTSGSASYSSKLNELKTAYANLSTAEKMLCMITISSNMFLPASRAGIFSYIYMEAGKTYIRTIDLINTKYYTADNTFTAADASSNTSSSTFVLYMLR